MKKHRSQKAYALAAQQRITCPDCIQEAVYSLSILENAEQVRVPWSRQQAFLNYLDQNFDHCQQQLRKNS